MAKPDLLDATLGRVQYEVPHDVYEEAPMGRMVADCRDFPSDTGCTLKISGEEDEVVDAATQHAVAKHGHEDTAELRSMLRSALKEEIRA